jgi:[acyl-carrier-protein] S-malonyltransferase
MKTAFLFPGQGSQSVGMGRDIAESVEEAAQLYNKANDILGLDLRKICFEGPADQLNTTTLSQPTIFVTSAALLAAMRAKSETDIKPDMCAGLSLGEYTALYAAGCMSFEETLGLVHKRGQAMQAAGEASHGAMVSIIGLDPDKVALLCEQASQGQVLKPANFNCPGQIVISGTLEACTRAEALAPDYGAIKAVRLEVVGAFHTEMMSPAAQTLSDALTDCSIQSPDEVRVLANVNAQYYTDSASIREGLAQQLISPVMWQACMERLLSEGVERFYEIGPGRVLTGLMRRIYRKAKVININGLDALKDTIVI